jgi:hypothetical protein
MWLSGKRPKQEGKVNLQCAYHHNNCSYDKFCDQRNKYQLKEKCVVN